jgi:hypothetical protein
MNHSKIDETNWAPVTVSEALQIFRGAGIQWWIAGGWALDLYLGKQTRPHEDTDILILRKDQLAIQEHLRDWQLFKTHQPGLALWSMNEYLCSPVNSVWARRDDGSPWAFEIMLMETDGDDWIYRRQPSIRGSLAALGMRSEEGIPYLAPEIQLLYKCRQGYRPKDLQDAKAIIPYLSAERREWLLKCLQLQFPDGHEWIELLQ